MRQRHESSWLDIRKKIRRLQDLRIQPGDSEGCQHRLMCCGRRLLAGTNLLLDVVLKWGLCAERSGVLVPTSLCVCVSLHSRHVFLAKRRQKQSWHFFLQTHYSATFTNAADYWEEMIIISWGVPSGLRPVPGRRYDESFRDQLKITVLPMFGQLPNAKLKVKSIRSSCINQSPNYQHFPVVRPEKCICLPLCEYLLRQCRSYPGQGASHNEPQQQCLEKTRSKSRYVTCTSMVA